MKKHHIRLSNRAILLLASLWGLTGLVVSCDKERHMDMYGCPPSAYNDTLPRDSVSQSPAEAPAAEAHSGEAESPIVDNQSLI